MEDNRTGSVVFTDADRAEQMNSPHMIKYRRDAERRRKKREKRSRKNSREVALASIGFFSYRSYLNSGMWIEIRSKVLARDNGKCVACGEAATCVHHKKYDEKTMSGKTLNELVSLCETCHYAIEFKQPTDGSRRVKRSLGSANNMLKRLIRRVSGH